VAAALALSLPAAARSDEPTTVRADEAPDIAVLAISALDGRAVVKEPGSPAAVKSSGDTLLDGLYQIRSIRRDFVVIERTDRTARGGVEYWVHAAGTDGRSEIRKVSRTPDADRRVRSKRIVHSR
jgi:hypothetical protein